MRLCVILAWLWLSLSALLLGRADADSISPWPWEQLQGLVQQSDTIVIGRIKDVKPGDPSQLGASGSATVSVGQVIVGAAHLAGQTITVTHSAADTPVVKTDTQRLFFLASRGSSYRLSFFHAYGNLPIEGEMLSIWMVGKAHGDFVSVTDVVTRLRRYARPRVKWTANVPQKVALAARGIEIEFVAHNTGPESVRLPLPPHHFDAVWALRLGPDGKRVGDDWAGVGHWEYLKTAEALPNLAPGAGLRRSYVIPFSALGIKERGTYRLGVRLESHRHSEKGERAIKGIDPSRLWLGGLDQFFVDVTVE